MTRGNLARLALLVFLAPGTLSAQQYPTKPVRLIVPFAPAGPTDIMSRAISERIVSRLGQPLVIENRPGAGGSIGSELAARSTPDGYTMLLGHIGTHAINVSLYSRTGYDPVKDFAPITMIATLPLGLWVNASVPVTSVKELIALAKAKPGSINFGSAGSGGPTHMAGEMLKSMAHIEIVHVPYKGNAASLTDLVAGRVQMMFSNLLTAGPQARAGKLRGLAVTSAKRSPQAPELPTIAESGVPGYDITPWYGVLFPAGTPRAIVNRMNHEIGAILTTPEVTERFRSQGIDLVTSTPEEFSALIKSEIPKWRKVVKDSGATAG
ncbi:MAG TPA: tripartite tricarboxylate transporter substrate binding protein [Burkholderiales bacterium]|nr:tripartite tricarboxylate transporter substrate binding protein [Burkholderiales bacterium]